MDLLVTNAWAQTGPAGQGSPYSMLFMMIMLFVIFWFFAIRPQMKRQKEHSALIAGLSKGDEAVTSGGLLGRIKEVGDSFVVMEVSKGVEVRVQKHFVQSVMPKGTMKTL